MSPLASLKLIGPEILHVVNIQEEAGVDGISGISAYGDRGIPCIGRASHIALAVNRECIGLVREVYLSAGLDFPTEEQICFLEGSNDEKIHAVVDRNLETIREFCKKNGLDTYQPFIHSKKSDQVAEILGMKSLSNSIASDTINNKAIIQRELRDLGVPVPEGKLVFESDEARSFVEELARKGYKSVGVKLVRAASGMGVFEIPCQEILNNESNIFERYTKEMQVNGLLIDG